MTSQPTSFADRLLARLPLAMAATFVLLFVVAPLTAMVWPTLWVDGEFSLARYATLMAKE
ncbi:MAG: hypothetical protein RL398_2263, partial [Planctomycetota bacterium]